MLLPASATRIVFQILKWILVAIVMCVMTIVIIIPLGLTVLGYRVNGSSADIAAEGARIGRVDLCKKIISYGFLSPPSGELRSHCVKTYAALTKDPTACELLMPSDYGFSCLGAAQKTPDACNIDFGRSVSWKTGEGPTDWAEATLDECLQDKEKSESGKKCCYIMRLSHEPAVNDCSSFSDDQPFMNSCLLELAMKKRDEKICAPIDDENKRLICEIQTRNLRK